MMREVFTLRGDGEYEGYWLLLIIYIDRKTGRKTKRVEKLDE